MELLFKLEKFEGPLDLLLHLVQKNKINLEDIPISLITKQYMDELCKMQELDMDITAEFLIMASHLLLIKSRMLLPKGNETEEDPRDELREKLMEYKKVKEAAALLEAVQFSTSKNYFKIPEKIDSAPPENIEMPINKLIEAFMAVAERKTAKQPPPKTFFKEIVGVKHVALSVKIQAVSRLFIKKRKIIFEDVFEGLTLRDELIATFLAILTLINRGQIAVSEKQDKIYLTRSGDMGEFETA